MSLLRSFCYSKQYLYGKAKRLKSATSPIRPPPTSSFCTSLIRPARLCVYVCPRLAPAEVLLLHLLGRLPYLSRGDDDDDDVDDGCCMAGQIYTQILGWVQHLSGAVGGVSVIHTGFGCVFAGNTHTFKQTDSDFVFVSVCACCTKGKICDSYVEEKTKTKFGCALAILWNLVRIGKRHRRFKLNFLEFCWLITYNVITEYWWQSRLFWLPLSYSSLRLAFGFWPVYETCTSFKSCWKRVKILAKCEIYKVL